eukprot:gb/GEZJ01002776.1/.p2 GENE.gb/GEZJ01002776.1/~~gb/GEZJ01002776.1/.p2  ORF type:complete len:105 (-),score=5.03 gb/GEZJ01002776.1/:989-1303(-)
MFFELTAHAMPQPHVKPLFTHRFLAELQPTNQLLRLYSQNIDGLGVLRPCRRTVPRCVTAPFSPPRACALCAPTAFPAPQLPRTSSAPMSHAAPPAAAVCSRRT